MDLSEVSVKSFVGFVMALIALLGALWSASLWFFEANVFHNMTIEHAPRILALEESSAEYQSIWEYAIQERKEKIRRAEQYCEQHSECRN